ncbi:hypothetical protein TMatcc_005328 [Talaromyces marneffei ATCC 18224]|uniref:Zona occludens toxin N-terminal domain-containing protein n=1 Tax=Talaromyces marneffei (strain ATCC 18224 / CBS 334.59 / QM 7333) TaxID=441960 RepID=B6QB95_TALMQ|nr:uncharacterized protein EYB26_006117 [Talaromyces marneffei]EEA26404.1 conserved hypothetical protein [Talaromyces marneffei ATCC 18224]KAE8555097.1 hypothetical protein EYB25_003645 [Talaromyces marneffei]QGA18432.1 hypothetical protein EYB26_006117 [Talaromyces marneffei]
MARSKANRAAPAEQQASQPEPSHQNEAQATGQADNLKNDIRKDVRMNMVMRGNIDREEIISRYVEEYPEKADWIRDIVVGYAVVLEDKAAKKAADSSKPEPEQIEPPKPEAEPTSGGSAPATDPTPGVNQKKKEKKKDKLKEKKKEKESAQSFNNSGSEKAQPKQIPESKQSKQPKQPKFEHPVSDTKPQEEPLLKHPKAKKPKKSKENKNIASEPTLEKEQKAEAVDEHADLVQSTNAILNDFKEHLATQRLTSDENNIPRISRTPDLERQLQFLSIADENSSSSDENPRSIEHSVLVSPILEDMGNKMPSQFGLLGHLASQRSEDLVDPRVMLNTNTPFSAFICGLQGSGKSHTTSCIIENCSLPFPALGVLKKPLSTLVLHYNEYSSNVSNQPSEAAFLASTMPEYSKKFHKSIPVRVLTSPSNFHNLEQMYSQIPSVSVHPFRLQPRHLNIATMLSLMSMGKKDSKPLYMAQLTRILREMALTNKGRFNYFEFRQRLKDLRLDRTQTPFLEQRLDLLDSFLDLKGADKTGGDYFVDGGVTILDLSCPFMDQDTACILFRIAIDLFLHSHPSRGKMIVADEAHKYMTNTEAANALTETFLNIIRQQRHLGTRVIISTQEPTISPRLIDLCSITIVHRFSSPEWYQTIKKHLPIDHKDGSNQDSNRESTTMDAMYEISSLRTGEALVFAPSAHLLDGHQEVMDVKHRVFKMVIRKRVTWDGGQTIKAVR